MSRRDFTLPPGSTLKTPVQRCNPSESYSTANRRWRKRMSEYIDAKTMAECESLARREASQRHFIKAFWGVPGIDAARALAG